MLICEYLGKFMSPLEIVNKLYQKTGVLVTESNICNNYKSSPKWRPIIDKFRETYTQRLHDVAGFHKVVRLERAEKIFEEASAEGDRKYALAAIEHQRAEVEGKNQGETHNTIAIQFNSMTDQELVKRQQQLLNYLKSKEVITGEKVDG